MLEERIYSYITDKLFSSGEKRRKKTYTFLFPRHFYMGCHSKMSLMFSLGLSVSNNLIKKMSSPKYYPVVLIDCRAIEVHNQDLSLQFPTRSRLWNFIVENVFRILKNQSQTKQKYAWCVAFRGPKDAISNDSEEKPSIVWPGDVEIISWWL